MFHRSKVVEGVLAATILLAAWTTSANAADLHPQTPHGYARDDGKPGGAGRDFRDLTQAVRSLKDPTDPRYQRPCRNEEEDPYSYLCAPWTATRAAQEGAFWTKWAVVVSALGVVGLIVSLVLMGVSTRLATHAAGAAARSALESAKLCAEGRQANGIAISGLEVMMTDFNERMKPRCVVTAMTLVPDWHLAARVGSSLPLVITVENLGGGTGRHLRIRIDSVEIADRFGRVLDRWNAEFRLAPLRVGPPREEKILVPVSARGREVHGVTITGRIGAIGDPLGNGIVELMMAEEFVWREDPHHRRSAHLVERPPGDDRADYDPMPIALPCPT